MKLREEILKEHSKNQCAKIVTWVGSNQSRFAELFSLFLHDEYRVVQRASWPVSYCVQAHPSLIGIHWKQLLKNLHKTNLHDAVKRNSIRLMQDIKIPEKYHGEVMTICFEYLGSPKETVAVKVFSMKVLGNLATRYPEIAPELKILIEDQLPDQTPGFKSCARKVLKQINS
ncbi:MAG TPA: hypothetical protein PLZ45_09725 [Ferruginibacter sp.]|nr:hypothetical protein [Chitinophagaceae bacterium]HRI24946.1 hypothetical protein [Ferruginibacter sp.]